MKMNKDIKSDWLFLLRSGEIEQGENWLHDHTTDKFCCLGVLCEMAVAHGVPVVKKKSPAHTHYNSLSGVLPEAVMKWAKLADNAPDVDGSCLTNLNDDGATFKEIADLIERHL